MSNIGETVHGRFPTHDVLWSKESGWHLEIRDATGAVAERRPAVPATVGTLIELHDDGSATVEVVGPYENDGTRELERVRVPDREHAEWHRVSMPNEHTGHAGSSEIGPHWHAVK